MNDFVIGDIVRKHARRFPNKLALIYKDRRQTWQQLDRKTNKIANMLLDSGLKKGDRVAILDENSDKYIELYFALAKSGIIAVPINYRLSPGEIANLLKSSKPSILFVGKPYFETIKSLKPQLKSIERYIALEEPSDWLEDYEETISSYPETDPNIHVDENDVFAIMYTSGTTGLPKGALSTHRNYVCNAIVVNIADHGTRDDVNLIICPLCHAGALFYSVTYMFLGCTQIVMRRFDTTEVLRYIQDEGATACLLVPTMLNSILNDPNFSKYNVSGWRRLFYGGGPMPLPLLKKALELLPNVEFTQGYGLTETLETNLLLPSDHVLEGTEAQMKRLNSAGRESPLAETRIVDDDGNDLPYGEVGEIWVKGPGVCLGFWENPEATANEIQDGWFKTGDLGYMDEERYLYVVDRKKDMIVSGGENIYAKEVDDVLYKHPAVLEAATIGVPDEEWGESVKAVVVLKKGMTATEQEIIDFCKKHLASYKKPRSVDFVDELPKTASGKILKRVLREKYWKGYKKPSP